MIILATGGEQAAIKEVIQVRGSVAGQLGVQGSLLLSLQDLTTAIMIYCEAQGKGRAKG